MIHGRARSKMIVWDEARYLLIVNSSRHRPQASHLKSTVGMVGKVKARLTGNGGVDG